MNGQRRKTDVRRWLYEFWRTSASNTFAVCLMWAKIYLQISSPLFISTLSLLDTAVPYIPCILSAMSANWNCHNRNSRPHKFMLNAKFILGRSVHSPASFLSLASNLWNIFCHYHYILLIVRCSDGFRQKCHIKLASNSSNGSDGIFLLQEIISNQLRHSVVQNLPFAYLMGTCTITCIMYIRSNSSHKRTNNK